jgi:hypothetical protein
MLRDRTPPTTTSNKTSHRRNILVNIQTSRILCTTTTTIRSSSHSAGTGTPEIALLNPYHILQRKWPFALAFIATGAAGWGIFLLYATNQEKLSSSVVWQIIRTVQGNADMKELLGDAIRPEPAWYLNGNPRINGKVLSVSFFFFRLV